MWHVCEAGELHTGFWCGNLKKRGPPGISRHRWGDNIKVNYNEIGRESMD
jgi:hypothetical protein